MGLFNRKKDAVHVPKRKGLGAVSCAPLSRAEVVGGTACSACQSRGDNGPRSL